MAVEVVVPQIGEAISELTIVEWRKNEGDYVRQGEVLFEVDSDKAIVEVEAFTEGTLLKILHPAGSAVMPQDVVGLIQPAGAETPAAPASAAGQKVSPAAQRLAGELGVDLQAVRGSGPQGRIIVEDVRRFAEQSQDRAAPARPARTAASPKAKRLAKERGLSLSGIIGTGIDGMIASRDLEAAQSAPPPAVSTAGTQPLSKLRQTVAARMQASKQTVPHFYLMVDVDMTQAQNLRAYCQQALRWEQPPTYTDLIVRASALALRALPWANVHFADSGLVSHSAVSIGVAVATEAGLIVPALADADQKNLNALSRQLREMAERARRGRLLPGDLAAKSMVVSNLGMYGVDAFVAIIDQPDAMILAVGRVADRAVPVNKRVEIRPMCTLTLSVDHRALDGAQGAQFLTRIKDFLEQPFELVG